MKNVIIIILLTLSFSVFGTEREKIYAPLLKTLKKEISIGKEYQEDAKARMDKEHPEFKEISEAYYMKCTIRDQLVYERIEYVVKHFNVLIGYIMAPIYNISDAQTEQMLNSPKIKKLIEEKAQWVKKYNNHPDKEKFWKVFQPIGSDLLTNKYRKPMAELYNEWKEVEKKLPIEIGTSLPERPSHTTTHTDP